MRKGKFCGGGAYRQKEPFKEYIRKRDNYTCQLCGNYGDQVDHIVPYAISGETKPDGVRVLCRACNVATRRQRYDSLLPLDEWFAWLESEIAAI